MDGPFTFVAVHSSDGKLARHDLTRIRSQVARTTARPKRIASSFIHFKPSHLTEDCEQSGPVAKSTKSGLDTIRLGLIVGPGLLPGQSSKQLLTMLNSFEIYHTWLESTVTSLGLNMDLTTLRLHILWHFQARSAASLNIIVLTAEAQLEASNGVRGLHDRRKQMAIALAQIRANLAMPYNKRNHEDTLCASKGYLFYELFRGGANIRTHYHGFCELINAINDLSEETNRELIMQGFFADYVIAICVKKHPRCTRVFPPRLFFRQQDVSNRTSAVLSCPYFQMQEHSSIDAVNSLLSNESVARLNASREKFSQLVTRSHSGETQPRCGVISRDKDADIAAPLNYDSNVGHPVNIAIRLATELWDRSIDLLKPLDNAKNSSDVHELYAVLQQIGISAWQGLPFVFLWIHLVGLSGASNAKTPLCTEQAYFVSKVMHCVWGFGFVLYQEIMECFSSHLWLIRRLQKPEDVDRFEVPAGIQATYERCSR